MVYLDPRFRVKNGVFLHCFWTRNWCILHCFWTRNWCFLVIFRPKLVIFRPKLVIFLDFEPFSVFFDPEVVYARTPAVCLVLAQIKGGSQKCRKSSIFTPFLTHFDPIGPRKSGYRVLFSGIPCIYGNFARTENGPQNVSFSGVKRGQKWPFSASGHPTMGDSSRFLASFAENVRKTVIFSDFS